MNYKFSIDTFKNSNSIFPNVAQALKTACKFTEGRRQFWPF